MLLLPFTSTLGLSTYPVVGTQRRLFQCDGCVIVLAIRAERATIEIFWGL
jgi:hypothetical protein